ncbi:putative mitochondrial ornithine carrier protein [Suhomyces tanzawaensis NRRL Y-17324]|uniref:Mitochondrial thiamine pyrophosphate carrier 1 n=1 Tax=Suhomyces tanzawaensis NRRL Y-17324 TaxID=984487 RepID=A0A1E4SGI6_9ASCO|nr:putative mitochondrial ornithine carrier protein [Suhomyces tanzawaensis NRRL Y-17324]ODV78575.1 putative mitochondrial ornithine carrier protein [Suhomyces tanzawaensis NRRL Y-17324]
MTDSGPLKEIAFGAVSGMVGKVVEFPFDTIKVRLQSSSVPLSSFQMIRTTYVNEGIINGFYKGFRAPLLGACAETSILFTSYNWSTSYFTASLKPRSGIKYTEETLPFWTKCASGGFAGFMASFILTPIELIKCQLQVSNLAGNVDNSRSYLYYIRQVIRNNGVAGLWSGLSSTLVREITGTAIWFGTYEYINDYFKANPHVPISPDIQLLVSGALAGIAFNWIIFPVDTIKSNIQTYEILHEHDKNRPKRIGVWYIMKKLAAKPGGIKNFYNGLGITLARAVPANALIFFTYEQLKKNF